MRRHAPPHREPAAFELRIDKLVYGGFGLGRHEGKVVFVPFTVPGDRVRVRAVETKRTFVRAEPIEILEAGAGRQTPSCSHFGRCGSCQWQHMDYPRQVEAKREILREILQHRIPETRDLEFAMHPSPDPFHYRSRARLRLLGAGADAKVGFFRFHTHQVQDIESCPLLTPPLDHVLGQIRVARRQGVGPTGDAVDVAASGVDAAWADAVADSEEEGGSDGVAGGAPHSGLRHEIGAYRYASAPGVFFQANELLAPALVERVAALAGAGVSALDLFCGVGLFTLPLAGRFTTVTAVERSPTAARLCRDNAASAGLDNVTVACADALRWMEAASTLAPPTHDVVVLDPPRTGAGSPLMAKLVEWGPAAIVYVSCDPNTLVRDLAAVSRHFRVNAVEGFDLFPQTFHFETVVRLVRR